MWRLEPPRRACASTVVGGGIGIRAWVLSAQVPPGYDGADPAGLIADRAARLGCSGEGVGFLTAAPVEDWAAARSGAVHAVATVGLTHPSWAAGPADEAAPVVGTVNIVAFLPSAVTDAALVNAATTATEAKTQALLEHGVAGTGTPTDAVCVLAPDDGRPDAYGGPRSRLGADLARAVHDAVLAGARGEDGPVPG